MEQQQLQIYKVYFRDNSVLNSTYVDVHHVEDIQKELVRAFPNASFVKAVKVFKTKKDKK